MGILNLLSPQGGIDAMINFAAYGKLDMVRGYLSDGVDINGYHSKLGITALMSASFGGRVETVRYLLNEEANANLKSSINNMTALELAKVRLVDIESGRIIGGRGEDVETQSSKEVIKLLHSFT